MHNNGRREERDVDPADRRQLEQRRTPAVTTCLDAMARVRVEARVVRRSINVIGAQVLRHDLRFALARAVDDGLAGTVASDK